MYDLQFILKFAFVWVTIFFIHEVMHVLEGLRQKAQSAYVVISQSSLGIPSMHAFAMPISDYKRFYIMGGFGAGLVSMAMCFLTTDLQMRLAFLILANVNLFYSIYEWALINRLATKQYDIGRYSLYCITIIGLLVVFR
jgi:hypothetical protein